MSQVRNHPSLPRYGKAHAGLLIVLMLIDAEVLLAATSLSQFVLQAAPQPLTKTYSNGVAPDGDWEAWIDFFSGGRREHGDRPL